MQPRISSCALPRALILHLQLLHNTPTRPPVHDVCITSRGALGAQRASYRPPGRRQRRAHTGGGAIERGMGAGKARCPPYGFGRADDRSRGPNGQSPMLLSAIEVLSDLFVPADPIIRSSPFPADSNQNAQRPGLGPNERALPHPTPASKERHTRKAAPVPRERECGACTEQGLRCGCGNRKAVYR